MSSSAGAEPLPGSVTRAVCRARRSRAREDAVKLREERRGTFRDVVNNTILTRAESQETNYFSKPRGSNKDVEQLKDEMKSALFNACHNSPGFGKVVTDAARKKKHKRPKLDGRIWQKAMKSLES